MFFKISIILLILKLIFKISSTFVIVVESSGLIGAPPEIYPFKNIQSNVQ